jgi:hypothetical protein
METNSLSPDVRTGGTHSASWKFPLLLLLVLLGIFFWKRGEPVEPQVTSSAAIVPWTPSPRPTGEVVRLEIDFGNGARRVFDAVPYEAEMTVADVLAQAREFRPGITFTHIGAGKGGFLTELEGLKNEGASGRNWRYEVAGTPGTMSFCLQKVAAGDLVRWSFAGENENR